jgi:hypothetical protein
VIIGNTRGSKVGSLFPLASGQKTRKDLVTMLDLIPNKYISIDINNNCNSIKELELEFDFKYKEILKLEHNPTSITYSRLKCELLENISKRELLAVQG